jgi:methylamine dehydrogenase accessory protein MauD
VTGWWLASYLVLWGLLAATLVVLLVVLRQLGLIYLRSRSGGLHLDEGPELGAIVTPWDEIDERTGAQFRFPDSVASLSLLVFASPHCAICKDTLRGIRGATRGREVSVTVVSEGEPGENEELRALLDGGVRFVSSVRRQRMLGIETIPYGIVADDKGVVLAKHIVNNLEDLEDLLDRAASQPPSAVAAAV